MGEGAGRTLTTVLDGLERHRPGWDCVLVGGPLFDERDARRLRRRADGLENVQLERFQAKVQLLTRDDPRGSLSEALRAACAEMRRLVEVDTATAAWQVAHDAA